MASRTEIFDVCVIGTGAGGGVMIQELTRAGFRVVALQRGPWPQETDFGDDELGMKIFNLPFGGDRVETYRHDGASPAKTGAFNSIWDAVGGSMSHWAGWSWRLRPDEFKVLSTEGPVAGANLADWPIDYAELEPFYERAEWDFGVSGAPQDNPFGPPRKRNPPNPPLFNRTSSLLFERAARKLGYHPFAVPVALNSRPYQGRPGCMYGGNCNFFGCAVGAKASSFSVSIPKALASGRLDLRANSYACEIMLGPDRRARGVRYLDGHNQQQEVLARQVVLAGNSIGSAHLLLLSKSGAFPHGLANSSGQVGKNLMFHLLATVMFVADSPTYGVTGVDGTIGCDDLHPSDPKRGFIRGAVIGESNSFTSQPIGYALSGAGNPALKHSWGGDLKRYLRTFPKAVSLAAFVEDLPMEVNQIDLDPAVKDRFGLPVPRITHRQHPNDLALYRWAGAKLMEIAAAAGAHQIWQPKIPGQTFFDEHNAMRGGIHLMGTCRMGTDPSKSVLNRWCQTHDVKNLWVVDGSCFPTSAAYNPTLTILANAYRVSGHFIREAKRLNLG